MSVARRRDGVSGVIDHTNLFLLVDRQGKLAYRFSLGPRQERWLGSALRLLLEESSDGG
jgi:cytochrome oxidase Cu insertion factor (SCO1/SenC/PrrC family)